MAGKHSKKGKIQFWVAIRGSKMSVLKLPIENFKRGGEGRGKGLKSQFKGKHKLTELC